MMTEFNPVNLKQGIGLLGASEKLQKRNANGEPGQMIPFLCMMGQICRMTTQGTEKILFDLPAGKEKMCGSFKKGSTNGRREFFKIDSKNNILGTGNDKAKKTNQSFHVKGKVTKTSSSSLGKIDLLPESGGQKQVMGKVENLLDGGLKESGAGKDEVGGQRTKMGDALGLLKFNLKKTADPVGESLKESGAGKDEVGGQRTKMGDALGLLKFSLKKSAVAAKGNSAKEPGKAEGSAFILTKNDGSGNKIKNLLKHQDVNSIDLKSRNLKGIETAVEHKETRIKESSGHKMEILSREISPLARPSDKNFSVGAYNHTSFHSGGSSAVINESAGSHGIETRALINQIANGIKRPGRLRIMLNPPRLGALDMDVLVRDNKVHIILQAENNDVRHILQSNVESLKSSLRSHGLIADNVNVSVQEKPDSANYSSGQNETLFRESRNREGNEGNRAKRDSQDHVSPLPVEEDPGVRIDGRVSLFI